LKKWEFVIFLTSACQLSCPHCNIPRESKRSLSREKLEILAGYKPYKVWLGGGEPLLAPSFGDALEIFGEVPVTVSTNGLLVPERVKLLERARAVFLSLEGMEKNTDAIRGAGVFRRVVDAAKMLRERGVEVTLRSSVWDGNLTDVPGLIGLARQLGAGLMFFPMLGAAPLTPDQQRWLFDRMAELDTAWVDQPNFFCYIGKESKCPAGRRRLAADWDGNVWPCQWLRWYYLGKVGDPFDGIRRNAETFLKAFGGAPFRCMGCRFQETCAGSCKVSMAHMGCPLSPQIARVRSVPAERGAERKLRVIRGFLRGVVSC